MNKILKYSLLFSAMFAASAANAAWIFVQNKNASALTIASGDTLQFTGSGTFTVDTNVTTTTNLTIGTSNTNVSPAVIDIASGCTYTTLGLLANTGRPDTNITFTGAGSLVFNGPTLTFARNDGGVTGGSATTQNWNFSGITGTWSLASKTINVQEGNYVNAGSASVAGSIMTLGTNSSFTTTSAANGPSKLTMSGYSTFTASSVANANGAYFLSGNASATLNSKVDASLSTSSFADSATATFGKVYVEDGATLTLASGTSSLNATHWIIKTATINFNATNVLAVGASGQGDIDLAVARTSTFNINANQDFGTVNLYRTSTATTGDTLTMNMGGDYSVNIDNLTFGYSASKVLINDFVEDMICIGNTLSKNEDESLTNVFAMVDGVQTKLYQLDSGYLSLAIPEPAEFAALFGALALGLAVYRRRGSK